MASSGVHGAHCCQRHGCKYGEPYCPVGKSGGYAVPQQYPCPYCGDDIDGEGRDVAIQMDDMFNRGRRSMLLKLVTEDPRDITDEVIALADNDSDPWNRNANGTWDYRYAQDDPHSTMTNRSLEWLIQTYGPVRVMGVRGD